MNTPEKTNWEQRTLENLASETLKEQRRARRWRIFFRFVLCAYVGFFLFMLFHDTKHKPSYDSFGRKVLSSDKDQHIAMIDINGVIATGKTASAEKLNAKLSRAMADKDVKGVLLVANSPGGSPVQSSLIYKKILELKKTYKKPILTVVMDTCASGCYYIVAATDEIYADESSIVGSIGVISQSFGYGEAAKKLGIDPRTFTSGKNKDFLNPARPLRPDEIAFLEQLLNDIHQNFIDAVKAGRGKKLSDNPDLFSGLFWTGKKAQSLGLIDGIKTPVEVAKIIGDYPVYDYSKKDPVERFLEKVGVEAQDAIGKGINQAVMTQSAVQLK